MDPITAAGISLSVASLALQTFAGCVKGYQLFSEAKDMPARYQHLRVRLRIEETRLLNWGQKVGLEQERLDNPSRTLLQNGELIIKVMLEMQALFKETTHIVDEYNPYIKEPVAEIGTSEATFDKRVPKPQNSMLEKTLKFFEKMSQTKVRLTWAMIKKDKFGSLIEKLIGYNTYIEGLLDKSAMEHLHFMQQQTYMAMLQLNSSVAELKEISMAIQLKTPNTTSGNGSISSSHRSNDSPEIDGDHASFARLADFKAHQIILNSGPPDIQPITSMEVDVEESEDETRSEGFYQSANVWIEWKRYPVDVNPHSEWNKTIEDRIKKLAILLGSDRKPEQFGAPHCIGYFNDESEDRYGFLYQKPEDVPPTTKPTSLHDLLTPTSKPSLTARITLAHAISRCLMYLHSVDWLHKGLRSSNIIFFTPPSQTPAYHEPIIAGFEYARPDRPDEETDRPPQHSKNDIYRHPATLTGESRSQKSHNINRSQKSHDVYSLGVVLVEIAYWRRIDEVLDIPDLDVPKLLKKALQSIRKVRERLLEEGFQRDLENDVGEVYGAAVRRCLAGGKELGIPTGASETNPDVGAMMQAVFSEEIVNKLGEIKI